MSVECKDTISYHPPEILTKIFSYCGDKKTLGRIEQVCKKWRDMIVQDIEQTLWLNVLLKQNPSFSSVTYPKQILRLQHTVIYKAIFTESSYPQSHNLITQSPCFRTLIEKVPLGAK